VRMRMAVVAAAGLLAAGCGLPFGGPSLASTSQLVNGAADAFANATGVEINGAAIEEGASYTFDVQVTPPNTNHVNLTQNGTLNVESVDVNGKVFYRGRAFIALLLGSAASDQQLARAVGDHWFTSSTAMPFDLSDFTDAAKIKSNFLTSSSLKRKDNVSSNGAMTAELTADNYILNITEASPYRLVLWRTGPGKTVNKLSEAKLAYSNYNKDFAIQTPTDVVDKDNHSTWPPMYTRVSISNSECNDPCILRATFRNDGGMTGASAPSTINFTLTSKADGSALASCKVPITQDVANGQTVTEACSLESASWTAFNKVNGNVYVYNAVVDNPTYD
jgi:hypothetical protein